MSSSQNYSVRPATLADTKAIHDIHVADRLKSFQVLEAGKTSQHYWRDAIEYAEPQIFVATQTDQVVGFVGFDRSRDKATPATMGEIWFMHVTPSHQGCGVGVALWDAAREGLLEEECTQVTAWLPLANERALRFFELAGFKREMNSAKTVPSEAGRIEVMRLKRKLD